jgi:nucleotide-binding universal stress UspA family protein
MLKYQRIMVTTDLSEASIEAFPHAILQALLSSCPLSMVSVVLEESGSAIEWQQTAEAVARNRMNYFVARYFTQIEPTIEILFGSSSPSKAIVEFARDNQMDLIVMASHGAGGGSTALIGGVAQQVSRHASCPVLIVPVHATDG